jgi:hypothetical protein
MFKLKNVLMMVLAANLMVACGGSDPAAPEAGNTGHDTGFKSADLNAAYKVLTGKPYITSKLSEIPEPSALLMFSVYDGKTFNAHQCSASLIGPDAILTNSHCIPDAIKYRNPKKKTGLKKNYSCSKWIVAHFPDNSQTRDLGGGLTQFNSSYVDCEKVIFASNNDAPDPVGFNFSQDYAIIKLAKPVTDREFLKPEFDGIDANQMLYTYSYDPQQGGGEFKKKECKAIEKSILISKSKYPITQNILMADCVVIKGNSGSPVVDANGVLRGALWGRPGNEDQLKQTYNVPDMTTFTYVSSVSCMNVPGYIVAPPSMDCEVIADGLRGTGPTDVFKAKYDGSFVDTASNIPAAQFFKYKVGKKIMPKNSHQKYLGEPVCIDDLEGFKTFLQGPNAMSGKFSLTFFDMTPKYNRYLQREFELSPSSQYSSIYYEVTPPFGNADPVYKLLLRDDATTRIEFTYFLEPCADQIDLVVNP